MTNELGGRGPPEGGQRVSRRWVWTFFHDEISELVKLPEAISKANHFRGSSYQLEHCPSTGRQHLQGYTEFTTGKRLAFLKKIDNRVHWEPANGDRAANLRYTSKGEDLGLRHCDETLVGASQGRRTDLELFASTVLSADNPMEYISTEPGIVLKYPRGVGMLLSLRGDTFRTKLRPELQVEVHYGPAGIGKTRYVIESFPLGSIYVLEAPCNGSLWFDGYLQQPTLLIDDFYGWIDHYKLLRILDIYPFRGPIKGGFSYAAWTRVYITSNRHPSTWFRNWPWDEDDALKRRIHKIVRWDQTILGVRQICEYGEEPKEDPPLFDLS